MYLEAFEMYLEDIMILKENFINLEIIHILRTENKMTDSLARMSKNNRLLSFIWMQSYQLDLQNQSNHLQWFTIFFTLK